jgi:uncharacterized membrane protein YccC
LKKLEIQWRWLRARIVRRRVQFALSLRITTAAIAALVVAQLVDIPLPLWTVITAVILTQMSVGRSLKATRDYLVGTLGGALYGGLIAVLIPHHTEFTLLLVFVIAVAPLALIAAIVPNMNVVPITAIIVLLMPTMGTTHITPFWSAVYRVLEVGLGAVIGLVVSFIVLPSSAHRQMRQAAARALERMARALAALLAAAGHGLSNDELHHLLDGIGRAVEEINTVGAEADRERAARLTHRPDTGPLRRTLLRLRHDLVIVGRAAGAPLPEVLRERLVPRLNDVASAAYNFMEMCGAALVVQGQPPPLEPLEQALAGYAHEVAAVRHEGLTRTLPGDAAEHFFAIGFSLEQVHKNLVDLHRVVTEWGPQPDDD